MNKQNLNNTSEYYELSAPFQEKQSYRQPLLLSPEDSPTKKGFQLSLDTPAFRGTLNSGSIDYGYVLQNLFDEGQVIPGNRNVQAKQNRRNNNFFMEFYQNLPVFLPNSLIMLLWKSIIGGIIILYFFVIPITICYTSEVWIFTGLDKYIIDLTFFAALLCDLILEFLTAFYQHGNLIIDKQRIKDEYIKTNFIFDFIAVISFGLISIISTHVGNYFLILFYFKYPAWQKIDYMFEEATLLFRTLRTLYNIGKIFVFLQFCFLMFSCIFYVIGHQSVQAGYDSWLLNDGNFGVIYELHPSYRFFFSYYFGLGTMTTTMGYGDITPLNVFECTWCLGGIIFAVFIFQVNVNTLSKIVEEFNVYPIKIFKKRISINKFMKSKQVPQQVQERVRQYLNEHWFEEGTRDLTIEQEVFQELAPEIKEELFFYSYGNFFNLVGLFNDIFSIEFLKALSSKVEEASYASNEIIFQDKITQIVDDFSFYYIDFGQILIYANTDPERPYWIKQLEQYDYFGEWSFLTGRQRQASASSLQYSRLYKIQRENFLQIIQNFNDDYEKYWMLKDQLIFNQDYSLIGRKCWTCDSSYHYASECDLTHCKPGINKLIIIKETYQFRNDKFFRSQRRKWPTIKNQLFLTQKLPAQQLVNETQQATHRTSFISNQSNNDQQSNIINKISKDAAKILRQYQIHKDHKELDRPYQFKYYFPKCNYDNSQIFKNNNKVSTISNVRRSTILIQSKSNVQTVRQSTIFAWQKQP